MNFPPPSNGNNNDRQFSVDRENETSFISIQRKIAVQKQARKWFLILLASGLVLGAIIAFGIVQIMHKFGLTDKPQHRLRIEQRQN